MIFYIATLVGVYGFGCYQLAGTYLSPIRSRVAKPANFDEALIPTSSGLTPAWTTPEFGEDSSDVVFVFAHGYGGDRDTWSDLMAELHEAGYASVAPAMPGQDASPDKTVGFGLKEAKVLAETVRWSREQFSDTNPKVVLVGLSMGGAAAWLASELEPSVDGIVTEGAYADFASTIDRWFDSRLPYGSVYLKPVVWIASAKSGLKPADVVPERAAEKWRGKPALVIQGELDALITQEHAERLAAASGAELWLVPGAEHAQCQPCAGSEYVSRLVQFAAKL